MKIAAITFWVLISFTFALPANAQLRNEIAWFLPAYEEFSFDPKIKQTLNPDFANVHYDPKSKYPSIQVYPKLERPLTLGIMYTRHQDKNRAWRLSWYIYYHSGLYTRKPGISMDMTHQNFSVDRSQVIWRSVNEKLTLSSYLQGTFRIGQDTYWINYVGWVDIYPYRQLADIGAAIGLVGKWHMTRHIHLGLEAGYTRWLFLYSNILDRDYYYKLKPWNQLDFKLTLGYAFGKEAPRVEKSAP